MKNIKYIFGVWAIALSVFANGQDTVYVGKMFHVTPGTIVKVMNGHTIIDDTLSNFGNVILNGNLSNSAVGEIFNSDTIQVAGNWINNVGGYYDDSPVYQGTVIFNGSGAQNIMTAPGSGNFFNVEFNSAGPLNVTGLMIIDSTVTFTSGIVNVANVDTMALADGMVYGGSTTSHVNGFFYNEGNGSLIFPLGDGVNYRPAELTNVPVAGVMPILGIRFYNSAHGGSAGGNVYDIAPSPYWQMYHRSGDYNGSKIRLRQMPADGLVANESVIVQSDVMSGTYNSIGVSSFNATEIVSEFIADQSYFSFGRSANMNAEVAALLQGDMDGAANMFDSLYAQGILNDFLYGNANSLGINMLPGYALPMSGGRGPVDYLSLYLRSTATGANLDTAYCWLMTDGSIRDFFTGTNTYATFTNYTTLTAGSVYYVVVDHRNHIPVMYALADTINYDTLGLVTFDVTNIANVYGAGAFYGGINAQLFRGNADADQYFYSKYIVDNDDFDKVRVPATGGFLVNGYYSEDVNMDGDVNATDWDITKTGVDMMYYSTVPF